jgi:hypothetical protein
LREEALKHQGLVGVHAMGKEELIKALAPIFGIDLEAAIRQARTRVATNKTTLKQEIRSIKAQRSDALTAQDATALKQSRDRIKKRKRLLRRLAEEARTAKV